MHTSTFFRLFPPPRFMLMKHAGLDISDDAIRCLEYERAGRHLEIAKHLSIEMPEGVMDGGDVKDEKRLREMLAEVSKTFGLSYVKVSIPEEKAYLFQTDVPASDIRTIQQNIEFKLEENVPLSAADAVFYFDILPVSVTGGATRASVSVVPRTYIEKYITLLAEAGARPVAFEIVPKAIAHAIVPPHNNETILIIHAMNRKTGIYIVSGGVVVFTSTIGAGSQSGGAEPYDAVLAREVNRVYAYWASHSGSAAAISSIALVGKGASAHESMLQHAVPGAKISIHVANAWQNAFNLERYVPPISKVDSTDYVVAAGLSLLS